jgi:hypothetical protein
MNDARRDNLNQLLGDVAKFFNGFPAQLRASDARNLVRELDGLQQRALAASAALELVADRAGAFSSMLLDETDPQ